jgi:hypothetical protein
LNGGVGSRLSASVIRNNTVWTCHSVGLDGSNQDYDAGTVDRTAIQWVKMNINDTGDPLSYTAHGRIYDNSLTQPRWYYFPSMSVNKNGDVVLAFAASAESETLSAYFSWRRSDGSIAAWPTRIAAGKGLWRDDRWGDYTHTTIDPLDDESFWTVQEYTDNQNPEAYLFLTGWGDVFTTRIAKIVLTP